MMVRPVLRVTATSRLPPVAVCGHARAPGVLRVRGAGFIKNWWAGVETLHNLFVKEHNYLCGMLREVSAVPLDSSMQSRD